MELLGHPYEAASAGPSVWFDAVHPDEVERVRQVLDMAVTGASNRCSSSTAIRSADGGYHRLACRALPVGQPGRHGRPIGRLAPRHRAAQAARGAAAPGRVLRRGDWPAEPQAVPRATERRPSPTRADSRQPAVRRGVPRPRWLQARQRLARSPRGRSPAGAGRRAVAQRAAPDRPRCAIRRRRVRRAAPRHRADGDSPDRRTDAGEPRRSDGARRTRGRR